MSSTFRLLFYPSDPSQAAEEVLLEGGERKGVNGMVEGAGRQAEEKDWQARGCRSQAEVIGGRAGNWPSRVTVTNSRDRV